MFCSHQVQDEMEGLYIAGMVPTILLANKDVTIRFNDILDATPITDDEDDDFMEDVALRVYWEYNALPPREGEQER